MTSTSDQGHKIQIALASKLSAPDAHSHAVRREHLLRRMFSDGAPRITVLQAPAGHGKTSLMLQAQEACRTGGALTGWISLDESDNDLTRFFGHLQDVVSALGASSGADRHNVAPVAMMDRRSATEWLIARLMELNSPVAIFLDDLHLVSNRLMLGMFRQLLAQCPACVRWFLASRSDPDLELPRLVVSEQALLIRAEDLRFSPSEVERLFERAPDVTVSEAELRAIHEGTEGWPAAVQLYRLAIASPEVRRSLDNGHGAQVRELAAYLSDNVLARQDRRVQEFLLKTSLLERMTVPLCNAVLESNDAQEILDHLEKAGLFVRRNRSEESSFTYHALFSRFLRDHLVASYPTAVRDLHRRAGRWLREEGQYEAALHHLTCAGDHADAADVFESWAERLVPDGHMVTVDRWSDTLPIEELERRPGLVVKIVWALAFLSRHRKLAPLLRILRSAPAHGCATGDPRVALSMVAIMQDDLARTPDPIAAIDGTADAPSRFRTFELSAVANARGYHAMATGDYDAALRHFARGRALSDGADATFTWAYSIGKSALLRLSQGQLQEALALFRTASSDPRMYVGQSQSAACLACGWIAALYEAGEMDAAMAQFRQSRDVIESAGIHDYLVIAFRAIARIHDQRGEEGEADAVLEEAEQLCVNGQWPRAARLIAWERVRRLLLAGRVDRARILAGRIEQGDEQASTEWVRISEDSEDGIIGRIRLCLHTEEPREALRLIQPCLRQAAARNRVHREMKLHILAAMAHAALGSEVAAHRSLEHALSSAAPGGFIRAFLDEGAPVIPLLLAHPQMRDDAGRRHRSSETDRFLSRLVGTIAPGSSPSETSSRKRPSVIRLETFTEREMRVLTHMANYLSNDQIAAKLFVSRDTVKYHLKSIYSKLGVKSRLDAIRAVHEREPYPAPSAAAPTSLNNVLKIAGARN